MKRILLTIVILLALTSSVGARMTTMVAGGGVPVSESSTYTATQACFVGKAAWDTVTARIGVYDAAKDLVGYTAEITVSDSYADRCANFVSSFEVGTGTYYIALFYGDNDASYYASSSSYTAYMISTGLSYPTFPSTLGDSQANMQGTPAVAVKNASGTVILGPSNYTTFSSASDGLGDKRLVWHPDGFTRN